MKTGNLQIRSLLALTACLLACGPVVKADTLLSNPGPDTNAALDFFNSGELLGFSFSTNPTTAYTVSELDVLVAANSAIVTDLTLKVFAVATGQTMPAGGATAIYTQTFTNLSFPAVDWYSTPVSNMLALTPTSTWTLAANSRYAITVEASNGSNLAWLLAATKATGSNGFTALSSVYSVHRGSTC